MRNPNRINLVVSQLEIVWNSVPDLRFGQLVDLVKSKAEKLGKDLFYMEDDEIQEILVDFIKEYFKKISC